jgi:hypothetical protein
MLVKDSTSGGKLWLPQELLVNSKATTDKGRGALRSRISTCCLSHDCNSEPFGEKFLSNAEPVQMCTHNGAHHDIPRECMARTKYLDEILGKVRKPEKFGKKGKSVWFPMNRVCRLHQAKKCTYGAECGHIHICREFWAGLVQKNPDLKGEPDPSLRKKNKERHEQDADCHQNIAADCAADCAVVNPLLDITGEPLSPLSPSTALFNFAKSFGSPVREAEPDFQLDQSVDLSTLLHEIASRSYNGQDIADVVKAPPRLENMGSHLRSRLYGQSLSTDVMFMSRFQA